MSELDADVLVAGLGAAGIAAARAAHEANARVVVVADGPGTAALSGGVLWGHARQPFEALAGEDFRVGGRYVTVAGWVVADARGALRSLLDVSSLGGAMLGVADLPTHPSWSARLVAQTLGARVVDCPRFVAEETFRETAARLDTDGIAMGLAASMRASCEGLGAVLFPPVLGLRRGDVATRMREALGVPVGEAVGGVGDPPGVRLERALRRWLPEAVTVRRGRAKVTPGPRVAVTLSDGATVRVRAVVLATGGVAGGGVVFEDAPREATAGAPVWTRGRKVVPVAASAATGADPMLWFGDDAEVVAGLGVRVDGASRVLDHDGETALCPWLFAAGDVTVTLEGSGLADALAAGQRAGSEAARHARGG